MRPAHDDDDDDLLGSGQLSFSQHLPRDAELMGLDRNTEEGAMIAMSGSLNSGKASHRVVAWLVVASLTLPLLVTLLSFLL